MVTNASFRKFALAFEDAVEQPHFHKTSFRARNKIFATLDEKTRLAVVKFTPVDQSVFTDISEGGIYPVDGGWGRNGATYINLKKVSKELMQDAVRTSYQLVTTSTPARRKIGKRR